MSFVWILSSIRDVKQPHILTDFSKNAWLLRPLWFGLMPRNAQLLVRISGYWSASSLPRSHSEQSIQQNFLNPNGFCSGTGPKRDDSLLSRRRVTFDRKTMMPAIRLELLGWGITSIFDDWRCLNIGWSIPVILFLGYLLVYQHHWIDGNITFIIAF